MARTAADGTLKELLRTYGDATGLDRLDLSVFLRAVLRALNKGSHNSAAQTIGQLKRPSNDPNQFHKRDANEDQLVKAVVAAMQSGTAQGHR